MKHKIFVFTALVILLFCLQKIFFNSDDRELESANWVYNSVLEEKAFFKSLESLSKKGRFKEVEAYVDKIGDPALKALSLVKIASFAGSKEGFERVMKKAFFIMKKANPVRYEDKLLQIIEEIVRRDDAEWLMNFVNLANYSNDLVFMIYAGARCEKISNVYEQQVKNDNFREIRPSIYSAMRGALVCRNFKDENRESFDKVSPHYSVQFNMDWDLKDKWRNFCFPLRAYFFSINGRKDLYELYREMSLSESQLKDMRPSYESYVEYGAKAFALSNDASAAILLIKTLKNPRQRSRVLKHCIRFLTSADDGEDVLKRSGILRVE